MRNYSKIIRALKTDAEIFSRKDFSIRTIDYPTFSDFVNAVHGRPLVKYNQRTVRKASDYITKLTEGSEAVYGITTSFGGNIKNTIPPRSTKLLQKNLILSHSANAGTHLPYSVCRGALLLRMLAVSKGYSGVRTETLETLQAFVDSGITPVIPAHGSMGASGDLGPLSAIARCLIGKGFMYLPDKETVVSTKTALKKYKILPIELSYREGLALINGTAVMTSVASFSAVWMKRLLENSLLLSALSIEALQASREPFDPRLHELKPHKYQKNVANVLKNVLQDSSLAKSHKDLKGSVEKSLHIDNGATSKSETDLQGGSYSLRAIPQVYQPILQLFEVFTETINTEISAVDDNPLMLVEEGRQLHGANFHGHPISVTSDAFNMAVVSVANISHARIDRLFKPQHSGGLPAFLGTGAEGLYLGMQGSQYTAAGITTEMRSLAGPLSIHQIVTNNDNQDMVSFGLQSTLKGMEMAHLLSFVLAVEAISSVQAVWLRLESKEAKLSDLSSSTRALYKTLLDVYKPIKNKDQEMTESIDAMADFLIEKDLLPSKQASNLWK